MTHHLGYEKQDRAGEGAGNSRNGVSSKTIKGDFGEVVIEAPRDREGSFEPKIVAKHPRRFTGFDNKIMPMYPRAVKAEQELQAFTEKWDTRCP